MIYNLVGSTHDQRVRALRDAIHKVNPLSEPRRFDALFDCYLIILDFHYEQANDGR